MIRVHSSYEQMPNRRINPTVGTPSLERGSLFLGCVPPAGHAQRYAD
jgi:hypothetical protein